MFLVNLFKKKEPKRLSHDNEEVFNRIMRFTIGDWTSFASYSDSGYIKTASGDTDVKISRRIESGHFRYAVELSNRYLVEFVITHEYGFDYPRLHEYFNDTISFLEDREARKISSAKQDVINHFLELTK